LTGKIFAGILLAAFVLLAYSATLKYGYVNWDDIDYTSENPRRTDISAAGIRSIFSTSHLGLYHPLTILSFSVEKAIFGQDPFVRRLDNLLLHIANTALVFLVFILLGAGTGVAFWTSLLWAVNPVHTESVAWIAERKNLLYAFFYLAALVFYVRYTGNKRPAYYAASLIIFLCSLFAKPAAVTFPFTLLVIDIFLERPADKRLLREKAPFFLLGGIFAAVAVAVQAHTGQPPLKPYPHASFVFYVQNFFLPFGLSAFYPYVEMAADFSRSFFRYALASAALLALTVWAARKHKNFAFGFMLFIVNIFPFLFLVPAGEIMTADRYLYIAGIGLAFIPAAFFRAIADNRPARCALFIMLLTSLAFAWTLQARNRAGIWKNGQTLWASILERYPDNETANLGMANACFRGKMPACYQDYLARTLRINPYSTEAVSLLAISYALSGKTGLAEDLLKKAVAAAPANPRLLFNLSVLYHRTGKYALAEKTLREILLLNPAHPQALNNLFWLYSHTGVCGKAKCSDTLEPGLKRRLEKYL